MEKNNEESQREQSEYIRVGMTMTPNQTIGRGNDLSYNVDIYHPNGCFGQLSRIDVRQVYGNKPKDAMVLQENPESYLGLFKIQRYDYAPGSRMKIVGGRLSSNGAAKFARKKALDIAREIASNRGIDRIVDEIDNDCNKLRISCKS